jgi:hypothetical protein
MKNKNIYRKIDNFISDNIIGNKTYQENEGYFRYMETKIFTNIDYTGKVLFYIIVVYIIGLLLLQQSVYNIALLCVIFQYLEIKLIIYLITYKFPELTAYAGHIANE